jgi:hypothetical protein
MDNHMIEIFNVCNDKTSCILLEYINHELVDKVIIVLLAGDNH